MAGGEPDILVEREELHAAPVHTLRCGPDEAGVERLHGPPGGDPENEAWLGGDGCQDRGGRGRRDLFGAGEDLDLHRVAGAHGP